jgi:hypothetical protein
VDCGYIHEAALPLQSMNFLQPEDGKRIHFETGTSFTGGSIDWTGLDPDTASNLAPLTFVSALSPAAEAGEVPQQSPDDVAFSVPLDGGEPFVVPQAASPDRDYLWLDTAFGEPISLRRGAHTLMVSYAGRQHQREAVVDAFMLVPAVACKRQEREGSKAIALCYDMLSGSATWEEQ